LALKFIDEMLDVKVNGGLRDCQLVCYLLVTKAVSNESQHFQLAGGKILFTEMLGEACCHFRRNMSFVGIN
jgi:hypothetical protein